METADVRILIIDDSQPIREFVTQALSDRDGFAVSQATDGLRGLERALKERPDLILLDFELPRLNGLQVLDRLEQEEVDIPVILITSHGSEAIAVEVFRKGVKDYLSKPFTSEELFGAIDRALTETRLRQERDALTRRLSLANRQLQQRVRELSILYRVGKSITLLHALDEVLQRVLEAAQYILNCTGATLLRLDKEEQRLVPYVEPVQRSTAPATDRLTTSEAQELALQAFQEKEPIARGSILFAPLQIGERVGGVLGVAHLDQEKTFSGADRQLLLALADYAAIAIENARLYQSAIEADRAKTEFISFAAHELCTPMTSIRGYADMLCNGRAGDLTPHQEEFVKIIGTNVERMQLLVSDLQDISRIETGHLRLERSPVSLDSTLDSALQTIKPQIDDKGQELTIDLASDLPSIHADPSRVTQILTNLLSNACKYTPEGGAIAVRAWSKDGYVTCAVSDTGYGISEKDQAQLFTRFFRSSDPSIREARGTGLGLCITKNLIELQGGKITVDSELGEGTTFTFTMPVVN